MGAGSSLQDHCELDETINHGPWTIRNGTMRDDTEISLFTPQKSSKPNQSLLRYLTKQLKIIRHPCVIRYVAAEEEEDGPFLMTERVVPLSSILESLSAIEICAGLQSILEATSFLHEKVGVCHNNICVSSVYVCPDGSWRLGGLEHSCKFSKATASFLNSSKDQRDADSLSPEEKTGQVVVEPSACCARDVFSIAVMTEALLEKMSDLGDLTKTFELRIQDECLNEDPKQRPAVRSLLEDRLFRCEFLEVESFLKSITLKTTEERQKFFKSLLPKLLKLPEGVIGRRLVPMLLSRFVLLDQSAVEYVLPSLLTPCKEPKWDDRVTIEPGLAVPLFTEPAYIEHVIPRLVKIMGVLDFHIHCLMLEYFPLYVHLIEKEQLEQDVFPQVLLGLRDSSSLIAALSLHALAEMVPILGRDVVIGGQTKTFFKEGNPRASNRLIEEPINNKMSNVQGLMEKVLLKELASKDKEKKMGKETSPADKEKKMREREKRREEMKKRREERKQARTKSVETEDSNQHAEPNFTTALNDDVEKTDTPEPKPKTKTLIISDSDSDSRKNDSKPKVTILYTDDEGDDWADLDCKGDYSAISDEIEKELHNMDYTNSSKSSLDSASKISSNGPSVLPSVGTTVKSESDKRTEKARVAGGKGKPLSLNKGRKTKTANSKPKSKQEFFGGAFDIKSIDIKVEQEKEVFDFFADMTPAIGAAFKSGVTPKAEPRIESPQETASKTQISFDVIQAQSETADDGPGWGEEEDW